MKSEYPTWREFMEEYDRHDVEERLLVQAIASLSVCAPYTHMTTEEVYQALVARCELVYASGAGD